MNSLSIFEKDAIAFMGLMSYAFKEYDDQYEHADGTITHSVGLNIFACIIDNRDGEILSIGRNRIHSHYNPLLHAEQTVMHSAIKNIFAKDNLNKEQISSERYYRDNMFYGSGKPDRGCTLYTTLEPCPFCTSALLVARMNRIVYLLPDSKFGGAFELLKTKYYPSYNILYEKLRLEEVEDSFIIKRAKKYYQRIIDKVNQVKIHNPNLNETLLLDYCLEELKEINIEFTQEQLDSEIKISKNKVTLAGFLNTRIHNKC